jgi:hypothetical protein
MKRECAERVMKTDYPFKLGFKVDLTLKMEIGIVPAFSSAGVARNQPIQRKTCIESSNNVFYQIIVIGDKTFQSSNAIKFCTYSVLCKIKKASHLCETFSLLVA